LALNHRLHIVLLQILVDAVANLDQFYKLWRDAYLAG
jgi:hypothetical protein